MELAKEIRIALVLYGGVSLAVYMNGVSEELLHVTRARRGAKSDSNQNSYTDLLRRMNSEIVIDIIAGNSAGGINGVLLSKALATGTDLNGVKKLWRDTADLKHLLNHEGGASDTLLNGSFMLRELKGCFDELSKQASQSPNLAEERKSQVHTLDLFVSASDIRGRRWAISDSKGQEIEGLTHGVMFHRKYRRAAGAGTDVGTFTNDFEGKENDDLLARISRATSAMPAAFPEQAFDMDEVYPDASKYDPRDQVYLHDGLLTDNKPFAPVLDTIFSRSADRKVDRWLLFLDPTPTDTHLNQNEERYTSKPDLMEALSSYLAIPRYQSIYDHLIAIQNERARADSFKSILEAIAKADASQEVEQIAAYLPYCRLRMEKWEQSLLESLQAYYLAKTVHRSELSGLEPALQTVKTSLTAMKDNGQLGLLIGGMRIPDISFICRYFTLHIQKINGRLSELSDQEQTETTLLLRYKTALWAAVDDLRQLEQQWWHVSSGNRRTFRGWEDALQQLCGGQPSESAVRSLIDRLSSSIEHTIQSCGHKKAIAEALGMDGNLPLWPQLKEALRRFISIDVFAFPLMLGHEGEMNKLQLLRISSSDAATLGLSGSAKLVSDDLAAFAGFLDRRWRANDLMWGRLDTADILITYMGKSYLQSKPLSAEEQMEWESFIMQVKAERFDCIIREELPHVGKEALQAYESLSLEGSPQERIEEMKRFFDRDYRIGLQTWKSLPFHVKLKRSVETLSNTHLALYRHYRSRRLGLRLILGGLSGFWMTIRLLTKLISRNR
ncbi:patatin-like protein [Paenibacillus sp. GCM10023252]|uniref:patatin-like protein n=1 Tax=Paenibacillus sp. GCM10023252 TaxID=3252649 RepID=UPI00361B221B